MTKNDNCDQGKASVAGRKLVCFFDEFRNVTCTVIFILLLSAGFSVDGFSQSTNLTGKVKDAATGQSLSGVELRLNDQTTSTDFDGRFIFRNLSPGQITVLIDANGYEPTERSITAEAGDTTLVFELVPRFGEGDRIFGTNHQRQLSKANRLQQENSFTSVLSSSQINRFSDYSLEDAMRRIPGAQISRNGDINLRGAGVNRHYVMVDGQRLASTGAGTRSEDLGAISSDMIREIEVINVLRPDMYADGIGGAVNLITRRPAGGEREFTIRAGGGTNTEYTNSIGSASRISLNYSEPLLDELTLVVDLNRQVDRYGWESLGISYNVADFGDGPVDVLESVSPGINTDGRARWGGGLQLIWEPGNRTRYHFRGLLNTENRQIVGHSNSWNANGNWESQILTGQQGFFDYNTGLTEASTKFYTLNAGGEHLFNLLNLSYNAGWSYGAFNSTDYRFTFRNRSQQHTIEMNDRSRPVMEMEETPFRTNDMRLEPMDLIINDHIDNKFSGRVDVELPLLFGTFKVGSSALLSSKDALDEGAYSEYEYTFRGTLRLNGFELSDDYPSNLFDGTYPMPWTVDSEKSQQFFDTNVPNFRLDEKLFHEQSDIWNYRADENIYAGYGMATFHIGDLTAMGGARLELTDADYKGQIVEFNRFDSYQETSDTTQSASYMNLFPSAELKYNLSKNSSVQLAYNRSISRPDYNQLAPFNLISGSDTTMFRGNHDLKPIFSDNLNFSYEHYFSNIGALSVNLFYKDIRDFIDLHESFIQIEEGDYEMFDPYFTDEITTLEARQIQYQNSDQSARVYGLELAWQQNLSFLPTSLGRFGTYLNYTRSFSEFDTDRENTTDFPRQSPHVFNGAIDHSLGRISSQISFHYSATALTDLQQSRTLAPSIRGEEEIYMDRFEDGWMDLSVSLGYRISNNVRFWADLFNLMGKERIQYARSRNDYPSQIQRREGTEFRLGVRFDL